MKKILIVTAVLALGMVSCKKEYTCECNSTSTDYDNGKATVIANSSSTVTFKAKKSDAEASCGGLTTTSMIGTTQDGLKSETTCNLK